MIYYNVTVKIEAELHEEWVEWMQRVHLPEVMATGMFQSFRFCRLLEPFDEDGFTYSTQYTLTDRAALEKYRTLFAPALQADFKARYGERFVAFRSVLETVE